MILMSLWIYGNSKVVLYRNDATIINFDVLNSENVKPSAMESHVQAITYSWKTPPESFPEGHGNIVRAFEEGLADQIEDLTRNMPDNDRIQIYLSSNRLQSGHTSANVTIGDWRDPLSGARRILHQISKMLNSNENFEVDDSLQLDVTHITMPEPDSTRRRTQTNQNHR